MIPGYRPGFGILLGVSSTLSRVPVPRRRLLAATLGLFAVLFVAVGTVATTGSAVSAVRVFSAIAFTIAAVLALMAWGVAHSVRIDVAEQRLDAAIAESIARSGAAATCGCGHEHDPDEMHVTSAACAHDGSGTDCAHDCRTCLLRSMRPSPTASRAARLGE